MEIDYHNSKIVGFVDLQGNGNAKIRALAYFDRRNEYHFIPENERASMFPPKGDIFAHNFAQRHYDRNNCLVCIGVKENEKDEPGNDDWIWNKSDEVYDFGMRIRRLDGSFSDNGQHNYELLATNGLLELKDDRLYSTDNRVFLIKAYNTDRVLNYWNLSTLNTVEINGKLFYAGYTLPDFDGNIDIQNDVQLLDWYVDKVLKKNWQLIIKEQNFRAVIPYIKQILDSLNGLDEAIIKSRMERLTRITNGLAITIADMHLIAQAPWFSKVVDDVYSGHKEALLTELQATNDADLIALQEMHEKKVQQEEEKYELEVKEAKERVSQGVETLKAKEEELNKLIKERQLEIELSEEEIESKRKEIEQIEQSLQSIKAKKNSVIEDFSVIKDVLAMASVGSYDTTYNVQQSFHLEELETASVEIEFYHAYKKSLDDTLKINNIDKMKASTLADLLASYNMVLVPDIAIAETIIKASKKCRYMTEYVSASWKSFEDFWINGLGYIVDKATRKNNIMHFLILQNINVTYLPNYMQPLVDLQRGVITKFPGKDFSFPDNLRIICTIAEDELIPLSKKCLQYIGCINNSDKKDYYTQIRSCDNNNIGYLSPKLLTEQRLSVKDVENSYSTYLDE